MALGIELQTSELQGNGSTVDLCAWLQQGLIRKYVDLFIRMKIKLFDLLLVCLPFYLGFLAHPGAYSQLCAWRLLLEILSSYMFLTSRPLK